jgi:hypothetical protein
LFLRHFSAIIFSNSHFSVCKMSVVTAKVLSTVNAPYGTMVSAEQLASKISDPASAEHFDPSAFSFFSEVHEGLQSAFIAEMAVDHVRACEVALKYSRLAGYTLPLAKAT